MAKHMLTTVDNPWHPFTHFDEWFAFDFEKGYNTCGLLDRITNTSLELSEADQDSAIEHAIDEIVFYNVSGMHRKVLISEDDEIISDSGV